MTALIEDLFSVGRVLGFEDVRTGLLSENHKVNTSVGPFFLKRYRDRMNTVIHEIKTAEAYFAHANIPIILPIKDRFAREAFWCRGSWYSLYPFIDGHTPSYGDLTPPLLEHIGSLLARIHVAGDAFRARPFQIIRLGNPRKLHMELTELRYLLGKKPTISEEERALLELLDLKKRAAKQIETTIDPSVYAYVSLLHGDFQYYNLFTHENHVTHVYDLERTALGPTSYELIRALLLDCFEAGWDEESFDRAGVYLRAYREHKTVSQDELYAALRLYLYNITHTTWLEASHVIFGSTRPFAVLQNQRNRIAYLSTHDLREFAERLDKKSRG